MLGCKLADTPMESTYKIGLKEDSPPVDKGRYQRLVGKLIYLSHTSGHWFSSKLCESIHEQFE